MEYIRVTNIGDRLFGSLYILMQKVFPPEAIMDFQHWKNALEDPKTRVFAVLHDGKVVGATRYCYYEHLNVAMTDFTLIGQEELGVGRFLAQKRMQDLRLAAECCGKDLFGMFTEAYNPYRVEHLLFGAIIPMDPFVTREVLSQLGYKRLDLSYVHPSWKNDGEEVASLDLCFLGRADGDDSMSSQLVADFLVAHFAGLTCKPFSWHQMIGQLRAKERLALIPF